MDDKHTIIWLGIASGLGMAAVVAAWFVLPVDDWLQAFSDWASSLGWRGVMLISAGYVLATLLFVPGFPMTLAVAVAYGWWALAICFIGGVIAAAIAFLAARFFMRDFVAGIIRKRPTLKAIDSVTEEEGFKTILLSRLTPVTPYAVANYAFGITGARFMPYLLATAVGIVPGTVLNVWMGVIGRTAATGEAGAVSWIGLLLGLAATVVLTVWMTRQTKSRLRKRPAA